MGKTTQKSRAGLDGVVVADTRISAIDGRQGKLVVRGLPSKRWSRGTSSKRPLTW
jgi:citrate synthase